MQLVKGSPHVKWVDEESHTFKMVDQHKLAAEWGLYNKKKTMKFENYA